MSGIGFAFSTVVTIHVLCLHCIYVMQTTKLFKSLDADAKIYGGYLFCSFQNALRSTGVQTNRKIAVAKYSRRGAESMCRSLDDLIRRRFWVLRSKIELAPGDGCAVRSDECPHANPEEV